MHVCPLVNMSEAKKHELRTGKSGNGGYKKIILPKFW